MKLVKPTKITSGAADELWIDQFLFAQAEPEVGTAQASVLGKADAAAGRELGGFDLRMALATIAPKRSRCSWVMVARRY